MKIRSSFTNVNNSEVKTSFKAIPPNPKYIPEAIGSLGRVVGDYVSIPEQKLFLALTALMFQPLIDLKYSDDEHKIDSAVKSASKAIAGGLTGVTIRALFLKITDKFIGFKKYNKLNFYFFPDSAHDLYRKRPEIAKLQMKQYTKSLGTLFAVLFMIFFSNSKMDVPITSDLQDLMNGVIKEKKSWVKSFSDVYDSRKKKIADWFAKKKEKLVSFKTKLKKIAGIIAEKDSAAKNSKESGK